MQATRTEELLAAQETLLKSWHFNATQVEKVVRGFLGRQRVKRICLAIAQAANQLELAQHLAWLRKKQLMGAVTAQIAYRRHRRYRKHVEACCVRLQRATRLLLFRLYRWRAVCKPQRAIRCYQYRERVHCHLLRASRQKQGLEQLATVFTRIRDAKRREEQERLWVTHPEKMAQLLRVQQHKHEIGAVLQLPPLTRHRRQERCEDRNKPTRGNNSSYWRKTRSSDNQSASSRSLLPKGVLKQVLRRVEPVAASEQLPVVATRVQRTRKQPTVYSPTAAPVKHRARRVAKSVAAAGNDSGSRSTQELQMQQNANTTDEEVPVDDPAHKKLEKRIVAQVKRLRFHLAYLEAYEGEGWRKASREKLKPSQELATARRKLLTGKRAVVDALAELQRLHEGHTQYPYLAGGGIAELLPEDIYCSRCGSTEADEDNDILICDNEGCQRAYHQKCQTPWLATSDIPVGNELWYCEVCLALFNSLKAINYAFGTTYEKPSEVFLELAEEEQEEAQAANDHAAEDEDDEEDDGDFVVEDGTSDDDDGESDVSSFEEGDGATSRAGVRSQDDHAQFDEDASEAEISDQELKYLRKSNVINANSRSTRSRTTKQQSVVSLLGQKAAKVVPETGGVVFGVVVDEAVDNESDDTSSEPQWQVVYYNDTMEMLTRVEVEAAIACAQERMSTMAPAAASLHENDDVHDVKLIVHGKRKRTQVDYRELNAAMFAGKEDSDDEAYADDEQRDLADDAAYEEGRRDDDDDYSPRRKRKTGKSKTQQQQEDPPEAPASEGGRSRRQRKRVDYNALNEGLVGC
ncbi:Phd-finger family homeodomain protein, partial [Globisporangium splendens]